MIYSVKFEDFTLTILHTWELETDCDWSDEPLYRHKFSFGDISTVCVSDVHNPIGMSATNVRCKDIKRCINELRSKLIEYYKEHNQKLPHDPGFLPTFSNYEHIVLEFGMPLPTLEEKIDIFLYEITSRMSMLEKNIQTKLETAGLID